MSNPDTPIVFESGVLRFDADGTLHVHLSHSPQAPHPLAIQPEGGEGPVPATVSEATCRGRGSGRYRDRVSLMEAESLPEGLVLTFQGYEFVQVELSGDVSILMSAPESLPEWFVAGKVHRFDGPEDGVRIWTGSSPPPKPPALPPTQPPPPPKKPPSDSRPSSSAPSSPPPDPAARSGCGLLMVLGLCLPAAAWLSGIL